MGEQTIIREWFYFTNTSEGRRLRKQLDEYCKAAKKKRSAAIRGLLEEALESKRVWVQQRLTEYALQEPMTPEKKKMVEEAVARGVGHFRR